MSATTSPIDRLRELGGELFLAGDRVRYRIPASNPEAKRIVDELRENREAIRLLLGEQQSKPPSLEEVQALLPCGVKVASYEPKRSSFAMSPISSVTNVGKFYRAYLADLCQRLAKPEAYHCPPLGDILSKLAHGGLKLKFKSNEDTA